MILFYTSVLLIWVWPFLYSPWTIIVCYSLKRKGLHLLWSLLLQSWELSKWCRENFRSPCKEPTIQSTTMPFILIILLFKNWGEIGMYTDFRLESTKWHMEYDSGFIRIWPYILLKRKKMTTWRKNHQSNLWALRSLGTEEKLILL